MPAHGLLAKARTALPEGRMLPDDSWRRRHRVLTILLWAHVPVFAVFGLARGFGALHLGEELSALVVLAVVAGRESVPRRGRAVASAVGLVSCSGLLVHLSGGYIEMHFHFFVMVALLSLYEDWVPFLCAIGFVVVHHGLLGALDPRSVFNHPDAIAHPWKWAAIHGFFVLGASAASITTWRINEIAHSRERQATEHLRALNEMKNSFLQAVSHELRTPLTSVLGMSSTLERVGPSLPLQEQRDLAGRLAFNARKLQKLLDDLLDLDRLTRGALDVRRRPVDMGDLVRRVVVDCDASGVVRLEVEPVVVALDGPKVERIIENLLTNAFKYTPAGTPVWLRIRRADRGVVILVEDAGPGVPEELRLAILEPFRRGNHGAAAPGTGVGLSLVLRFAELHGGSVQVQDRPGGGASFRVYLPGEDGAARGVA